MGDEKKDKTLHLINDLVLREESCNMRCSYCLYGAARLKEYHRREQRSVGAPAMRGYARSLSYDSGSTLRKEVDAFFRRYNMYYHAPIAKVSGGEVFLVDGICELLLRAGEDTEVVQVLTNGSMLTEQRIQELKGIPNISVQVSIDGMTLAQNRYRTASKRLLETVLAAIARMVELSIPIEIYCVLTNANCGTIDSFVDYICEELRGKVYVSIFPVRGSGSSVFAPGSADLSGLSRLLSRYAVYRHVLPPLAFLEELYRILGGAKRLSRCYVPLIMFQSFEDGIVTPCPNCWTVKLGNIIDSPQELAASSGSSRVVSLMCETSPFFPFCKRCITDYHAFDLFFSGTIGVEDLCWNRPSLQGPRVQEALSDLRRQIKARDELARRARSM